MSQRRRYGAAHKGEDAARSSRRRSGGSRDVAASKQILYGVRSNIRDGGAHETSTEKVVSEDDRSEKQIRIFILKKTKSLLKYKTSQK
ncbi:hypothetical protein Bca4012_056101 [Brassica carinata]